MDDDVLVGMKKCCSFLVRVVIQATLLLLFLYLLGSFSTVDGAKMRSGDWLEERYIDSTLPISQQTTKLDRWQHRRRQGSFLTVQTPTPERLSVWFGTSHHPNDDNITDNNSSDDWLLSSFNHQHVGLTNPFVRVIADPKALPDGSQRNFKSTASGNSTNDWWPETAYNTASSSSTKWRVLLFCRYNVGQGRECYQRVRDKALAWQFASDSKGILQVAATSDYAATTTCTKSVSGSFINKQGQQQSNENDNDDVSGVYSPLDRRRVVFDDDSSTPALPAIAASELSFVQKDYRRPKPRRSLVTYTSIKLIPKWLSHIFGDWKLYCLNPVHIVYDWVDQHASGGHSSTLYTSTAYATGKGHWLCGEERITVALRENGQVDVELISFSKPSKSFMGRLVWPVIGKMQTTFFVQELDALEHAARAY